MLFDLRLIAWSPTKSRRFATGFLLACVVAVGAPAVLAEERSPPLAFSLQDQFDRTYTEKNWPGKILVLIVSDRKGSQFNGAWQAAVAGALKPPASSQVQYVGVADLHSVPGFMHGLVKRYFPQDKNQGVLLDWDGWFKKTYGLVPDQCNVLIFGPAGNLLVRLAGRDTQSEDVAAAARVIENLAGIANPKP